MKTVTAAELAELRRLHAAHKVWCETHRYSSAYSDERAALDLALEEHAEALLDAVDEVTRLRKDVANITTFATELIAGQYCPEHRQRALQESFQEFRETELALGCPRCNAARARMAGSL